MILLKSARELEHMRAAGRILAEEHRIYSEAVRLFAEGRLSIEGRSVHIRESP